VNKWIENIVNWFGNAVVLIVLMPFFKGILKHFFETIIKSVYEKNLEQFKDNLYRGTRAYELLLDREMKFYDEIHEDMVELARLQYELRVSLDRDSKLNTSIDEFIQQYKKYTELFISIKNKVLVNRLYIPKEIIESFLEFIRQIEINHKFWFEIAGIILNDRYDSINKADCEKMINSFIFSLEKTQEKIFNHLKKISIETSV
jgi:hypothetical protein